MITSPVSSATPGQELARLTLISPGGEAAIRRRSTISKSQSLGEINGAPVLGPLGPPHPITEEQAEHPAAPDIHQTGPAKDPSPSDVESDATLVSESYGSGQFAGDKADTDPLSPRTEPESDGGVMLDASSETHPKPEPPKRPPPVPPRPIPESERQRQLIEEVEIGAQQDVTEVINNVLFQSQCAIKPRVVAPDGEQLDQIKE